VFGLLAGNAARLIVSYLIHSYRPHLSLDLGKAKELFGFGKWVLGSSILVFLLMQGDDIFVGKLLGATLLGFYQMAYRISNIPALEISSLISRATFPAYSKLQDKLPTLREAYLKVLQITTFISIPVAGGIFILAPEFTQIFLTQKWMPMVPAMRVLAIYGLLGAIGATTGVVFLAVGKPEIRTKIQSAQLILLAIAIYPLTIRWGILGTSMAVTASLIFNPIAVYKVLNIVKSGYRKPIKIIVLPLIGTLVMIFTIFILKIYIFGNIGLLYFLLLAVAGVFTYLLVVYLFDRFLNYGIKHLIQEQFSILFFGAKGGK
jgi:O-antigen/teichoic acid export membrane protein